MRKTLLKSFLVVTLITSWLLTSWPGFTFIKFPPKIRTASAAAIVLDGTASDNTNNSSSVSVDVSGANIDDGDLVLFFGSADGNGYNLPTGAGFTQLENDDTPGSHNNILGFKIADSEPSSYTVETVGGTGERGIAIFAVYSGIDVADPIDDSNSNTGGSGATAVITSITPSSSNNAVAVFVGIESGNNGSPIAASWPGSLTERLDNVNGPPGGGDASSAGAFADEIQTSPAAVSGNISLDGGNTNWGTMAVSINSAADAPYDVVIYPDDGGLNEIAFNNARMNDTTPIFRASATYESTFTDFQIELNTTADFDGTSYTEIFSGTYSSETAYNLQTTGSLNLPTTDGVTYYVRIRASADDQSSWGLWSDQFWSYTYKSAIEGPEWFQTTDEQFSTGTMTDTDVTGSGSVGIIQSYNSPVFETGEITIDDSLDWSTIDLVGSYTNPPVILATPATAANCEAAGTCAGNNSTGGMYPVPVVRNVSTSSFDISMCVDGTGTSCVTGAESETFHWFAFDVDDTGNYSWIEAGTTSSVSVGGSETPVSYSTSFSSTPDVWTQAQTYSQSGDIGAVAWATPKSASEFSFVGCVHSDDANACSGTAETFGYVAIDVTNEDFPGAVGFQSSSSSISNSLWDTAGLSAVSYTSPRVMITTNSEGGGEDPKYAWARNVDTDGMEFRFCEQDDATTCNSHNAEDVYWFAVEQSVDASSGTIQSPGIDYGWFADATDWDEVTIGADTTNGSITIDILDENEADTGLGCIITGGSSSCAVDISSLDPGGDDTQIYISATLSDSSGTPYLTDWSVSAGTGVAISLNTDGSVSFGDVDASTTVDTTAGGIDDTEVVNVDSGPADLDVQATTFSDGSNTWTLSTSNGADQVHFEFSPDGSSWTSFAAADTNYSLATSVSQGSTQDLDLRLTTPTSTSSFLQHSTTVTITASAP